MTVMHIAVGDTAFRLGFTSSIKTYCGLRLREGEGAPRNAPVCPVCVAKAGWAHDKRTGRW